MRARSLDVPEHGIERKFRWSAILCGIAGSGVRSGAIPGRPPLSDWNDSVSTLLLEPVLFDGLHSPLVGVSYVPTHTLTSRP